MSEETKYVDIYSLPVAEARIDEYRRIATEFGTVVIELGGLRYREFAIDDPSDGHEPVEGEVLIGALVEFASKQERDSIMNAVMKDPRVEALTKLDSPGDMSRMRYGGYTVIVDL